MEPKNKVFFDETKHGFFADEEKTLRIPGYSAIIQEVFGNKFENVPPEVLEKARVRGVAVHKLTERHDRGETIKSVDEEFMPYLTSWMKFKRESGVKKFDLIETQLFSKAHWFCGIVDRVIGNTLIDIKTSAKNYDDYRLQSAAYTVLVEENYNIKIEKRMVVTLTEGGYKTEIHDNKKDFEYWHGILTTFKWKVFK